MKLVALYCYICTGASKKKMILLKSIFFCNISKSDAFIYYRFITFKVKHFKCVTHESQKSVSQNIRIFTFEFQ